jgi:hypothetical protein
VVGEVCNFNHLGLHRLKFKQTVLQYGFTWFKGPRLGLFANLSTDFVDSRTRPAPKRLTMPAGRARDLPRRPRREEGAPLKLAHNGTNANGRVVC